MPVALTTINAAKEQSSTYQPILLADFLFCDGSKLHLSTHPLNTVEGGFPLPGAPATDYKARLASHNIQEIQSLSQQGISLIPSITLAIEDPDAAIYTANETTIGFRGAVVTLTLVLWDVGRGRLSERGGLRALGVGGRRRRGDGAGHPRVGSSAGQAMLRFDAGPRPPVQGPTRASSGAGPDRGVGALGHVGLHGRGPGGHQQRGGGLTGARRL